MIFEPPGPRIFIYMEPKMSLESRVPSRDFRATFVWQAVSLPSLLSWVWSRPALQLVQQPAQNEGHRIWLNYNQHSYPLVMTNIAIENDHENSGFSHEKWWFSIVTLVYHLLIHWNLRPLIFSVALSPPATRVRSHWPLKFRNIWWMIPREVNRNYNYPLDLVFNIAIENGHL